MSPHVDSPLAFAQDREVPGALPRVASSRSAALVRAYAANDPTLNDVRVDEGVLDTYARHANASNGFGDAGPLSARSVESVHRAASRLRSRFLGDAIVFACQAIARGAREAWASYRRYRAERATRVSLAELDDRTLHDLGLDRSELSSVGAELAGHAERTRVHAMLASYGPYR